MIKDQGYLLALDASSTMMGVCVWDKEKDDLVELTFHAVEGENLLEKAKDIETYHSTILKKYPQINELAIEDFFTRMASASSAKIIILLAQVNFLNQYCAKKNGLEVNAISVREARKYGLPMLRLRQKKRVEGKNQKEQVFDHLLPILGEKLLPHKVLSRGPRKGLKVPCDHAYDMADAFVVCKGFLNFRLSNK